MRPLLTTGPLCLTLLRSFGQFSTAGRSPSESSNFIAHGVQYAGASHTPVAMLTLLYHP